MSKTKAFLYLLGAAAVTGLLIVAWEMLGDYVITLRFLPDVPLVGGRVAIGFLAAYWLFMGIRGLFTPPPTSEATE